MSTVHFVNIIDIFDKIYNFCLEMPDLRMKKYVLRMYIDHIVTMLNSFFSRKTCSGIYVLVDGSFGWTNKKINRLI